MPAYILVDVAIHQPGEYESYKSLTPASLEKYGGKFLVRGGQTEVLEGDVAPGRIVVLEFPNSKLAREWWASPEYSPAKALRQRAATTKMILVEGFNQP